MDHYLEYRIDIPSNQISQIFPPQKYVVLCTNRDIKVWLPKMHMKHGHPL